MSEEFGDDDSRRLAVEAKVFKRLDKRREEKSAIQAINKVAREEQNAETYAVLAELDNWTSRISETICGKLQNRGSGDDIVGNTLFLDILSEDMQKLDSYFGEKSSFLAAYDVKRIQNLILENKAKFQELQDLMQPKKKFGFKGNKKKQTSHAAVTEDKKEVKATKNYQTEGFHVTDRDGDEIIIKRDDISSGDILLSRLKNCTIKILTSPSTVHIADLENCVVLTGPVKTSVFVERCKKCTFAVACQQLRTHETRDSEFYLHVTSKGIIEDCNQVRFAPYNFTYENSDSDFKESGLALEVNNWDKIDDFNWLSSDQASPNWSILPEEERKKEWIE